MKRRFVNYRVMHNNRYNRQIRLQDFGPDAQQHLKGSSVLIVGLGGLGIPVAQYLNAMGVGTLGLLDSDTISLSNLHRQVLYAEDDIGQLKVDIAQRKLQAQNSGTKLISHPIRLSTKNALEVLSGYDLIIDASDNFPTRYLVNDACVILDKPYIYGAIHGYEGQVSVFNYKDGPTYRCLYPEMPADGEVPDCDTHGVLGITPAIIGSLQTLEAVKVLTGKGEALSGKLLLYDGLNNSYLTISVNRDAKNASVTSLEESYELTCNTDEFLTVDDIKSRKGSSQFKFIDVRSPEEFRSFSWPSSINMPLTEIDQHIGKFPFEDYGALICQSDSRCRLAQAKLAVKGIHLPYVKGGLDKLADIC